MNEREASGPVPVTHILTLSGRSLQSQPFHRESFYVTGTPPLYVPLSLPHLTPFLPRYGSSCLTPFTHLSILPYAERSGRSRSDCKERKATGSEAKADGTEPSK